MFLVSNIKIHPKNVQNVASELKDPIRHSNECQIGYFSSEATITKDRNNTKYMESILNLLYSSEMKLNMKTRMPNTLVYICSHKGYIDIIYVICTMFRRSQCSATNLKTT